MQEGTYTRTDIEETMRSAYLSYAMSVITARALPDVRDGLKPVQRRILYAMNDMGLRHDRPTRKSARIVGEVLGKYHPHGDAAVYEAMVRMAQDFNMRYPLVDGQGNFGSIDGDGAAAVRYTEARLSAIGEEMLTDLDKDAVDLTDNFDGTLKEPLVLPAKVPNLLVNGVGGIAVGMATNIPPHNLGEIADAVAYLVDRYHQAEDVTLDELMQFVKGPDFPTGGMILGDEGVRQAYATGRGRIVMRSQVHPEELSGGRMALVVTELPYQVNKSTLVGRIATLAREGRVEGIGDLRDESDRMGIRIVIELKRGTDWEPVLAGLLKYSQLQATFGVNMLALVEGEPRTLSLKRALLHYIDHRYTVVERRSQYELERARQRAHVLEGLLIALDHLDEVIDTIRRSRTADTARENLCKRFNFSEAQAQAILDLQLRRLAALERRRVQEEYREVIERIGLLQDLLSSETKIRAVVKDEILELKRVYGDPRRTRVSDLGVTTDVSARDLVVDAPLMVVVTARGSISQVPANLCHAAEGGLIRLLINAGEPVLSLSRISAQQKIVIITHKGRAFALQGHQIPDLRQQPGGLPLASLARLDPDERIVAVVPMDRAEAEATLAIATVEGRIKRVTLSDLAGVNLDAVTVIGLMGQDAVAGARPVRENEEIVLITAQGRAIRFAAADVRVQGLAAQGMKGIGLRDGDAVVGVAVPQEGADLLIVTAQGFAKRSPLSEYSVQGRGGQGTLTVDPSKSALAGPIVAADVARPGDQVLLSASSGLLVHRPADEIPRLARDTWGSIVTRTRRAAAIQVTGEEHVTAVAICRLDGGPQPTEPPSPEGGVKAGPVSGTTRRTTRARPSAPPGAEATASAPQQRARGQQSRRTGPSPSQGPSGSPNEPVATGEGEAARAGRGVTRGGRSRQEPLAAPNAEAPISADEAPGTSKGAQAGALAKASGPASGRGRRTSTGVQAAAQAQAEQGARAKPSVKRSAAKPAGIAVKDQQPAAAPASRRRSPAAGVAPGAPDSVAVAGPERDAQSNAATDVGSSQPSSLAAPSRRRAARTKGATEEGISSGRSPAGPSTEDLRDSSEGSPQPSARRGAARIVRSSPQRKKTGE